MKKVLIGSTIAVGLLFAGAGSSSAALNLNQGISAVDISSMDVETAMLAVQQQRANLLDAQLQTQLAEVQKRNEQMANLNAQQGNSQQMDMLRLQSLGNKRNESFDTMTNFIKKMQDSRSSIIGNMR